ncbi:SDH family Clp fold serine proteinase [Nocardia brasiliensis]|uniref:SDH family Clp fold serine proteinase n=1 Tax=Nocardia brasiliensis TaxID=37326 RepID=UPI00245679FD|nr:ATP-dependent Clp protease proteolytic subunit [Nocardia brasiliensis]
MAKEGRTRTKSEGDGQVDEGREAEELPAGSGAVGVVGGSRTPLFHARHESRYARQQLIREYQELTGANLIVIIDQIFPENMTYLEELLFDCDSSRPLHVLLASPGGDGETAIRIVRSMQARCTELTILVPDMAKSAATLLCLGADRIVMGPGGDLGPVDPQFQLGGRALASAKEIVEAIDEAERRIADTPETFPLFATLLADVNMLMVEQARSALARSEALVTEALSSNKRRNTRQVTALTTKLKEPLISDPASHSAVISADAARKFGLPAESIDPLTPEWEIIWALWTRYFTLGGYPAGPVAIYEGSRASHVMAPQGNARA